MTVTHRNGVKAINNIYIYKVNKKRYFYFIIYYGTCVLLAIVHPAWQGEK